MSLSYGQFGAGFAKTIPAREALQFRDLVKARGADVKVVTLTRNGEDFYGNPVYSESSYAEKAFVDREGRELNTAAGTVKLGSIKAFVVPWAAVQEEGCELEVDGVRYHISSLVRTRACVEIEAVRKA